MKTLYYWPVDKNIISILKIIKNSEFSVVYKRRESVKTWQSLVNELFFLS